jgi:LuxR family transcriptional regulator
MADLTPRQRQALTLAAYGQTDAEAAMTMSISRHTVQWYLREARRRLNATNTTHAVVLALVRGIIEIDTKFLIEGAASAAPL